LVFQNKRIEIEMDHFVIIFLDKI